MSSILVPVDFTDTCKTAIRYAHGMSQQMNMSITLLHVAENESDKHTAEGKMQSLKSEFDFGTTAVDSKIEVGDFLEDIGRIADLLGQHFIVMGTHGERGLQRVFGSFALKVVKSSKVALVIVQNETVYKPIGKIAMTIDLARESTQILKHASSLAKYYNAELHLVGGKHSDADFRADVLTNMRICKEFLTKNGVAHDIHLLDRQGFDKNLIEFCSANGVDMIAASHYQNTLYMFSDKFVQQLIMNKLHIPLITIEATSTSNLFY